MAQFIEADKEAEFLTRMAHKEVAICSGFLDAAAWAIDVLGREHLSIETRHSLIDHADDLNTARGAKTGRLLAAEVENAQDADDHPIARMMRGMHDGPKMNDADYTTEHGKQFGYHDGVKKAFRYAMVGLRAWDNEKAFERPAKMAQSVAETIDVMHAWVAIFTKEKEAAEAVFASK